MIGRPADVPVLSLPRSQRHLGADPPATVSLLPPGLAIHPTEVLNAKRPRRFLVRAQLSLVRLFNFYRRKSTGYKREAIARIVRVE